MGSHAWQVVTWLSLYGIRLWNSKKGVKKSHTFKLASCASFCGVSKILELYDIIYTLDFRVNPNDGFISYHTSKICQVSDVFSSNQNRWDASMIPLKKTPRWWLLAGRTRWVVNSSCQEILQFFSAWPAAQRERVGGLLSSCSKGDVQKADDSVRETWWFWVGWFCSYIFFSQSSWFSGKWRDIWKLTTTWGIPFFASMIMGGSGYF